MTSPATPAGFAAAGTAEPARTRRRRLVAVWLAAGGAVAAMVAATWCFIVRNGGLPPAGDMLGHAAAAEWLRTLPWWDWRGWSTWFYGGQAIGVNYPPLVHAWLRFTHPIHGQMAAVALGLLVLLPWGALCLARACGGSSPRTQRAAVGAVLVLAAAAGPIYWALSGFHSTHTYFGSWPAMVALALGLFCMSWAAAVRRPLACGVVAGLAVLLSASVVPGVAVVCAVLLVTGGAGFGRAVRWAATAGAAALAVCAWWLVPFLARSWRGGLVRWDVSLADAWGNAGSRGVLTMAALASAALWAARRGSGLARRLGSAAAAGLVLTIAGDSFGFFRTDRWLQASVLVAAVAAAGLADVESRGNPPRRVGPAGTVIAVAVLIVLVALARRWEIAILAVWLLWWPRRVWAAAGALAWAFVLLSVPFGDMLRGPVPAAPTRVTPLEAAATDGGREADGLVHLVLDDSDRGRGVFHCTEWVYPWRTTRSTGGRLRPLAGLYQETSQTAEFLTAQFDLLFPARHGFGARSRPHWPGSWLEAGVPNLETPAAAAALGARWYATCDAGGNASVTALPGTMATGAAVVPHAGEDAWHEAAVDWWIALAADTGAPGEGPRDAVVPILSSGESAAHPADRAAAGVSLRTAQDRLVVRAEAAGWAWLRVPWDPDWRSLDGTPVRRGGPGHLLVWADRGVTELRWSVPGAVDIAAAATTGAAALAAAGLCVADRRRAGAVSSRRASGRAPASV